MCYLYYSLKIVKLLQIMTQGSTHDGDSKNRQTDRQTDRQTAITYRTDVSLYWRITGRKRDSVCSFAAIWGKGLSLWA